MKPLPQHQAWTREKTGNILLRIKVEPRSSRPGIAGTVGDALKIRLSAPPVDGKANAQLIALLAKTLKIRKDQIDLVSGGTSRLKQVRIRGIQPDALALLLAPS